MREREWKALELELNPYGPQRVPLDTAIAEKHARLLALRPASPEKDRIPDPMDRDRYWFDIALLNELIAAGKITPTEVPWSTKYAERMWGLKLEQGIVSQTVNVDLIWALRMPEERAAQPCLLFGDGDAKSFADGSHRLTRQWLDGKVSVTALCVADADMQLVRKPL